MTVEKPTQGSVVLSWMPVAVMAVVAGADVIAGPGVGLLPLVSLGPAFSGLVGGWRRTALIGAVALVLCVALGLYDGLFEERRGFTAMASVAGVTGVGVAAAVTRRRREAELASVRSIAEVAQRVLLRPVPRTACPLQAAVSYTSAVAEARIGGDLYEMVASPHGIRVIVGDVQGKGLAAVETAVVVLGAFRAAAHDEPDLVSLGERLERSVASRNRSHSPCLSGWGRTAPTARSPTGWTSLPGNSCCCTPTGSPKRGTRGDRSTHLVTGRTCSRPPTPSAPWRPCKGNPHET